MLHVPHVSRLTAISQFLLCSLEKGALFALEVLHTMGLQFFDVSVYAVGAGGICLAVYRGLQGQQFGDIWDFTPALQSTATEVILGAVVGAIAGGVGILFRRCVAPRGLWSMLFHSRASFCALSHPAMVQRGSSTKMCENSSRVRRDVTPTVQWLCEVICSIVTAHNSARG